MKQIFDWLREQTNERSYDTETCGGRYIDIIEEKDAIKLINEAEAKWEEMQKELVKQLEEEVIALEDNYGDLVNCIPVEVVLKIIGGGTVNA